MKITVLGLWHLGCVTAACCARHFQVTGLDPDATNVAALRRGKAPLFEPGLDDLIRHGLDAGRLHGACRLGKLRKRGARAWARVVADEQA